jgi:hypothetical protein
VVRRSWLGGALSVVLAVAACSGRYTIDNDNAPAAAGQTNIVVDSDAGEPTDASLDAPADAPSDAPPDADAQPGPPACGVPADIDTPDAGTVPGCKQEPVPETCPRKSCESLCPPDSYAIGCYGVPLPRPALGCTFLGSEETTDRDDYCCPCL